MDTNLHLGWWDHHRTQPPGTDPPCPLSRRGRAPSPPHANPSQRRPGPGPATLASRKPDEKPLFSCNYFSERARAGAGRGETVARRVPTPPPALPAHSSPRRVGSQRSGDAEAAAPDHELSQNDSAGHRSQHRDVPGDGGSPACAGGVPGEQPPALPGRLLLTSARRPAPPASSSSGHPAPAGTQDEGLDPAPLPLPARAAAGGAGRGGVGPSLGPLSCPHDLAIS